jgi:hypothetical protein|tara:strand:- start:232 stop:477 length:246 start_codon:yes stop_codon:yes gene_type:complete
MKNNLTEQQKINEIIGRIFQSIIRKNTGKTFQDLTKKHPELKSSADKVNQAAKEFQKTFEKSFGKERADKIDREIKKHYKF